MSTSADLSSTGAQHLYRMWYPYTPTQVNFGRKTKFTEILIPFCLELLIGTQFCITNNLNFSFFYHFSCSRLGILPWLQVLQLFLVPKFGSNSQAHFVRFCTMYFIGKTVICLPTSLYKNNSA